MLRSAYYLSNNFFFSPLIFYIKRSKHLEKLEELYSEHPYTHHVDSTMVIFGCSCFSFIYPSSICQTLHKSFLSEKCDLRLQVAIERLQIPFRNTQSSK